MQCCTWPLHNTYLSFPLPVRTTPSTELVSQFSAAVYTHLGCLYTGLKLEIFSAAQRSIREALFRKTDV